MTENPVTVYKDLNRQGHLSLEWCERALKDPVFNPEKTLYDFFRHQSNACEKKQAWKNFQTLKAIRPKYADEGLDERYIEALFALADTPEKFIEVFDYLCSYDKTRAELIKFLTKACSLLFSKAPIQRPASIVDAVSSSAVQRILLCCSALTNIMAYHVCLIREENIFTIKMENDDDEEMSIKGHSFFTRFPELAGAIYQHQYRKFAEDYLQISDHATRLEFLERNQRWLKTKHLIYISLMMSDDKTSDLAARADFFNLPFVRARLQRGIKRMISQKPIPKDDAKLLVRVLKQNDLRKVVNLTKNFGKKGAENYVKCWLAHTPIASKDNSEKYNAEVAQISADVLQIIASDPQLFAAIPVSKNNQLLKNNIFLKAANTVYTKIASPPGWFSLAAWFSSIRKNEFIQWFGSTMKLDDHNNPDQQAICQIIANDADLFDRLKKVYCGKRRWWGLLPPREEDIARGRRTLKVLSPFFRVKLEKEDWLNSVPEITFDSYNHESVTLMLSTDLKVINARNEIVAHRLTAQKIAEAESKANRAEDVIQAENPEERLNTENESPSRSTNSDTCHQASNLYNPKLGSSPVTCLLSDRSVDSHREKITSFSSTDVDTPIPSNGLTC